MFKKGHGQSSGQFFLRKKNQLIKFMPASGYELQTTEMRYVELSLQSVECLLNRLV